MPMTAEEVPPGVRPFPLAPRFDYGGLMVLRPGDRVWWRDASGIRSGAVRDARTGQVRLTVGGKRFALRGWPEDKCLIVRCDDTGEDELVRESRCHNCGGRTAA